jgi:hypothetical protein
MKRRLVLESELRELIARLSQHRPTSEKLGQRLSEAEYLELKAGLGREDVRVVRRFLPGEGEQQPVAEETRSILALGGVKTGFFPGRVSSSTQWCARRIARCCSSSRASRRT